MVRAGLSGASFQPSMPAPLPVTALLFASYAEFLGASSIEVSLSRGASVADLVAAIRSMPGAERLPPRPMIAVNQRYASYEQILHPGDEVAVIPPVAGG
jgi:molybdopterin converting factor small subunit